MKSSLKKIGSLIIICLLAFSTQAIVVFQDNFNYSSGEIYSVSGGPPNGAWVLPYGNTPDTTNIVAMNGNSVQVINTKSDAAWAFFTNGLVSAALGNYGRTNSGSSGIFITNSSAYYFTSNSPAVALYASFTVTVPNSSILGSAYFAVFTDTNFDYRCRLFVVTNHAASGDYRIGVNNFSSPTVTTNIVQQDLVPGNTYNVVARYVLSTGLSTVWVNPASEADTDPTITTNGTGTISLGGSTNAASLGTSTCAFGLRSTTGGLNVMLGSLIVGTTFVDVAPASVNPPTVLVQPEDINVFAGSSATFSTLAAGDATLGYQWFSVTNNVTNSISGATTNTLTLTSLTTNQTGSIFCIITNGAGTNSTRLAALTVSPEPIPPIIDTNITPIVSTNTFGDTVTFSVVAHGLPTPNYQWEFVPATNSLVTNIVSGANASGTNTAALTLSNLTTNQAGSYFVILTNIAGTNTSAKAVLTVIPPSFITIAQLRGMVDNTYAPTNTTSLYTIQGTVTTWTNMTASTTSLEFYMQDSTAGTVVFWSGASPTTNLPPPGATVKVTGPLAVFDGLLEIEPVFTNSFQSVTIVSTNTPASIPQAQPLPFDPNITGSPATMNALEGTYFVASNVTLTAAATFVSGANLAMTANASNVLTASMFNLTFTNQQGETFDLFVNADTDIPNKAQPTGPVTIYGVLGYFSTSGAGILSGYEFIPSRYADIISYQHLTNVIVNARKGDLATNNYTELVVRPDEILSTYVSIGDAAGGSITFTPTGTLPTGAYWTNIVNSPSAGSAATAVFQYTGSALDAGNDFTNQLIVTSSTGISYTNSFTIYVPTPQEQQIAITEFLANPTTNTSSAFFNPLQRSSDTTGILTNDQYVEIANQSPSDLTSEFTLDEGNISSLVFDSFAYAGLSLQSSNSLVIYGGAGSASPGISPAEPSSTGLRLPTTGSGLLVLRNQNGNIIDRVVYSASTLSTNGSLSRFPTINDAFVPQAYISTNLVTPNLQYDGGSWSSPTKVPMGVTGVFITYVNGQAVLNFAANVSQASTLWNASTVTGPYSVIFGQPFPTGTGVFTNVNSAAQQFYFITTQ